MQADFSSFVDLVKTLGPSGAVVAYLFYRDFVQPRRNGRNSKSVNTALPTINAKDFASSADVSKLGESFREFRGEAYAFHNDILQRVVRVETKVDGLERAEDREP